MTQHLNPTQAPPKLATFASGLVRPKLPRREQLAVLVRDGSTSMAGQKASDASAASSSLVEELARTENRGAFWVAVVDFASASAVVQSPAKADGLFGKLPPLIAGGSTNLAAGLADALAIVRAAPPSLRDEAQAARPVVVVFTDGHPNVGDPRKPANELKALADVVTVAFGTDADEALLRELATSPAHAYRCTDGRELRRFFAAIGSTLTRSLAAGTSPTASLGSLVP
ncbi:MAG: vWA domain-containing protein [Thermoanaerobaculia bacterium]